jgi:hypothetical protein
MYLQESLEGYRRAANAGIGEVELRFGNDFFLLKNADGTENWSRNAGTGCGVRSMCDHADGAGIGFRLAGMVMGRLCCNCPQH